MNNKTIKSRYKKLALDFPFLDHKDYWEDCIKNCTKIPPVFHSNGFYMDRLSKLTWLEINGEAWLYSDVKWFNFQLEMQEREGHKVLSDEVFERLDYLVKRRYISYKRDKELYNLWYHERCYKDTNKVRRDSSLYCYKSRKEFTKEIENIWEKETT